MTAIHSFIHSFIHIYVNTSSQTATTQNIDSQCTARPHNQVLVSVLLA